MANDKESVLKSGSYTFPGARIFFLFLFFLLGCSLLPGVVIAEGIKGFLEFSYGNSNEESTDQAGETYKTKTNDFRQLYNLSFRRTLFPNISLNAGGTFEKDSSRSNTDGDVAKSSTADVRPFVSLTLKNQVFTLGGRYDRNEIRRKDTDMSVITDINEKYSAIFGWRPEGLPSMNMRLEKSKFFDRERVSNDTESNSISSTFRYVPEYGHLKGFDFQYRPAYRKTQDKLGDIVTTDMSHSGRVTFSDTIFNKRTSIYTSYNINHAETKITRSDKTAEIITPLFPFSGLSAIDDMPAKVVLALNSALIDGDVTVSAGINIGLPAALGNTDPRNIGLDFVVETEMNSIFLWVNRELPSQISDAFKWDIYTSSDNDNWTFLTTVPAASFGPFQNRFEINFPNVKTRYIKVVTTPLKVGDTIGVPGDFSNILVTEIQAFLKVPSGKFDKQTKDTRTSHLFNLDTRTKILDVPALYYELSYYYTKVSSSFRNATLSNGLTASHRFSSIILANARVAREDDIKQDESDVRYIYNASVNVQPLRTLSHTLNYSGTTEEIEGKKSNTNSVFLNNTAELYRGISMKIDGGVSVRRDDSGEKSFNTTYSVGSGITPHKRVGIDLYYINQRQKKSGGEGPDSIDFTRRGNFSITYKPVDTVYLFVSFETIERVEKTRNFQNYGISWSPFPDGSLQFTIAYNEILTSDEGTTKLLSPSVIWYISRVTVLNLSTQIYRSESDIELTDRVISNASLRTIF